MQRDDTDMCAGDTGGDAIEALLADCLGLPAGDVEPAIDRACLAHPDFAEEIRARYALLQATGLSVAAVDARAETFPERLGPFRLLRRLGGGGMGVVYLAEQQPLHREVALKLIRPEHLFFPGARRRFAREVEAVARLQHPGIVPIYTYGEADHVPYFAMERIVGCTLAEALEAVRGRELLALTGADLASAVEGRVGTSVDAVARTDLLRGSWTECSVRIAERVALALEHAHSRGVYHRDVKPSNIALTVDGRVLLLDFGLARAEGTDKLTRSGSTLGSLHYMPPEVVRGDAERIEPCGDVYSLAVTLYEMLTLRAPFEAESSESLRHGIIEGRAAPLRKLNPAVAADVEIVCLTAMDRDAGRRYASASAFGADLANLLAHRPIVAQPPGPALRVRRWTQRHPTLSAAVLLCGAFVLLAPSALLWQQHRHNAALRVQIDELEAAGYRNSLLAGATLLKSREILHTKRVLDDASARLRGWEWGHLRLLADCSVQTVQAHAAAAGITAVAVDPALQRVATASDEGPIRIWGLADLEPLGALQGHRGPVNALVALGGGRIASAGVDGKVVIWDLATETQLRAFEVSGARFGALAVSDDRKLLAASGDTGHFEIWELETGRSLLARRQPYGDQSFGLVFAPDGQRLISAWTRNVHIHAAESRIEVLELEQLEAPPRFAAWDGAIITRVALDTAGTRVFASGSTNKLAIWDLATLGTPTIIDAHDEGVTFVAFQPDGDLIATASRDGTIRLWHTDGRSIETLRGHEDQAWCLAFTVDGKRLLSGGRDGQLKIWEVGGARARQRRAVPGASVQAVAFDPRGEHVAIADWQHHVWLLDLAERQPPVLLEGHTGVVNALCHAPVGPTLYSASADGSVRAWDLQARREAWSVDVGTPLRTIAVESQGRTLIVAGDDGVVRAVSIDARRVERDLVAHAAAVWCAAVDPAGREVVSGSADGVLKLCDLASGRETFALPPHAQEVRAVAFSPDGRWLASGSTDREVRLWARGDLAAGPRVLSGHDSKVLALAFGPQSDRLFTTSPKGMVLKVWHVENGTLLATFAGDGVALCLAAAPGGDLLATGLMRQASDGQAVVSLWRSRR